MDGLVSLGESFLAGWTREKRVRLPPSRAEPLSRVLCVIAGEVMVFLGNWSRPKRGGARATIWGQ